MSTAFAKGTIFLLLCFSLPLFVFSLESDPPPPPDSPSLLDRQESQLRRLETLVDSLSKTVSALESSLSACSSSHRSAQPLPVPDPIPTADSPGLPAGVAVTKHKTSWAERFQFAAAARLSSSASAAAAAVLPYEDLDGLSKYFAVGDSRGRVFIFSSAGDVVLELPALFDSPVTAVLSYLSSRRNESLLFAGHADGSISAHRLWESSASTDDWLTLSLASSRSFARGVDSPPITLLEVHLVGRNRYILASDGGGRIRVFTENGTLYGTAIVSSGSPLAFMKQRLLFLTEAGAASLDLRTMTVRETECEGLNGSIPKAYTFDSSERSKAYGFTAGGDLVHIVLLGDIANLKCRVRSVRKAEIDEPVSIQTMKGYLLVASHDKVFVYNISSHYYGRVGAPRPLFSATLQEIKSSFVNSEVAADVSLIGKPLIAADREKLVVLGFGDGYIGIYRSNFPVFKVESNAVVWSGPALLFILFLIGIWQFYVKKKDSLGWMPEESFNASVAATPGSLLNHATNDRAYADSSRTGDPRDLRGSALRGATRRYVSPHRYGASSGMPFRPPTTADPSFRGSADLKFRGQNIEPTGFPKRREPLFPSAQVPEDHAD